MRSTNIEDEINALHALVSSLDTSESIDEGYIEIVEAPSQSILERLFSFNGVAKLRYYFLHTLLSVGILIGVFNMGGLENAWGVPVMAIAAWSLLANAVKRTRDIGADPRGIGCLLFVPILNLVILFALLVLPSGSANPENEPKNEQRGD
jgi:uncharacterized membrane protein YhaH (DUF805 family)